MNEAIRQSLFAARKNPEGCKAYIKEHAQEMDDAVIEEHIRTFVTDYSLDVGEGGMKAVERLLSEAGFSDGEAFVAL